MLSDKVCVFASMEENILHNFEEYIGLPFCQNKATIVKYRNLLKWVDLGKFWW